MPEEPKDQRRRFEQAARELGVDIDEEKLKEALRRLGGPDAEKADAQKDREDPKG
tara:strand:+ start:1947 stop:2111 length:165 start_codon:yes stop_codon:yes gene_type:complete